MPTSPLARASWDLAGFTSAIVLAMIALLIGYESVARILAPVQIHFAEAIPIACVGLAVNIASAWLLSSAVTITVTATASATTMLMRRCTLSPRDPAICSSRCLRTESAALPFAHGRRSRTGRGHDAHHDNAAGRRSARIHHGRAG